jgi:hypothetical protein
MKKHRYGAVTVGLFLAMSLLASTAVSSDAWSGGGSHGSWGGGSHGSGGGSHGSWGGHGGRVGGSWGSHGGGNWHGGRGWHGGGNWHGHGGGHGRHFFGPRVFLGVGVAAPFWWYPYGYAYPDPYAYPIYSPPVAVESEPQTYIQQGTEAQQYWYYCLSPEGYYPYVKECPGGWQQVAPQPPPPPR